MWQKIKKWLVVSLIILLCVGTLAFVFAIPGVYEWIERTIKRLFGQGIPGGSDGDSEKIARDETLLKENGRRIDDSIGQIGSQVEEIKRTGSDLASGGRDLKKIAGGLREIAK